MDIREVPLGDEEWKEGVPGEIASELSDDKTEAWVGEIEERETVSSDDADEYDNLKTPAIIQIPVVHCNDHSNSAIDRRHISGTLSAATVRDLPWALCDANPREPTHNQVVSDIQDTVLNEPTEMQCRNGGLTMVASFDEIDEENRTLTLGLKSREGLVNGGHTQLAISTINSSINNSALIEFEVVVLENDLNEEDRVRIATNIAETRNYEQELEERSRADHRGFYNPFKQRLQEDLISWHENDSAVRSTEWAIPSDHLVRLFTVVDPNKHQSAYAPMKSGHGSSTTSKAGPHKSWFDDVEEIVESDSDNPPARPFEHIYPILPSVLELRDGIAASLYEADLTSDYGGGTMIRGNLMWRNYILNDSDDDKPPTRPLYTRRFNDSRGVDLSTTLEALLLGYLRGDMWLPESPGKVAGWFTDPFALWERNKVRKLDTINDAVDFDTMGGVTFSRNNLLFREEQLLGVEPRHSGEKPYPEVLYDDDTRARYFRVDDDAFSYEQPTLVIEDPEEYTADDATHYLDERKHLEKSELVEFTGDASAPTDAPRYCLDTTDFFVNS